MRSSVKFMTASSRLLGGGFTITVIAVAVWWWAQRGDSPQVYDNSELSRTRMSHDNEGKSDAGEQLIDKAKTDPLACEALVAFCDGKLNKQQLLELIKECYTKNPDSNTMKILMAAYSGLQGVALVGSTSARLRRLS